MDKLTVGEAAAIAVCIARALHYAHRVGWAHNDLKLENIVFRRPVQQGETFDPVLVDFGIATRTQVQTGAGSIYIMAPEQVGMVMLQTPPELQGDLDKTKVDVWGLGVVLYRMLSGKLPFYAHNERNTVQLIQHARPTSLSRLSQIPEEVDELIIDGCLAKDPHKRLSMLELGKTLSELSKGVVASRSAKASKGWLW
jgi:serine/threonine-protein kinase